MWRPQWFFLLTVRFRAPEERLFPLLFQTPLTSHISAIQFYLRALYEHWLFFHCCVLALPTPRLSMWDKRPPLPLRATRLRRIAMRAFWMSLSDVSELTRTSSKSTGTQACLGQRKRERNLGQTFQRKWKPPALAGWMIRVRLTLSQAQLQKGGKERNHTGTILWHEAWALAQSHLLGSWSQYGDLHTWLGEATKKKKRERRDDFKQSNRS